ncbi:MADF domain [Cinara cedri]|uniref:MADF domain n=1 Tax=Cinara cedri TaxID=506608 RepID=A0A5E4M8V4_9HEMI|nr:MADF domain [Cinara cedri]
MAETEDQNHTTRFIEEYRSFQLLWDTNHEEYTNKMKRNVAIVAIGIKFNMDPTAEQKKTILPRGLHIKSCFLFLIQQHQGKLEIARKIITRQALIIMKTCRWSLWD